MLVPWRVIYLEDHPGTWLSNFEGPFFAMVFVSLFLCGETRGERVVSSRRKKRSRVWESQTWSSICRSMD